MEAVSLSELEACWSQHLAASDVRSLEPFCSTLHWSQSVHAAFHPDASPILLAGEHGVSAFASVPNYEGGLLVPLDAVWMFGAPAVGAVPEYATAATVDALIDMCTEQTLVIGGYVENSPWWHGWVDSLYPVARLYSGEEHVRCRASLDGGLDGYLSRRTRVFRRNLRQASRRAIGMLTFEVLDTADPAVTLARLHAIEQQSWKGMEGSGIEGEEMALFYAGLVPRLHALGALRVCVAVSDTGSDVGFVLGGVLGSTYRGLQLSFTEEVRALSVGNLLQWHELQRLCSSGNVHTYDIGMDMEYKRAWTEEEFTTRVLIAHLER